MFYIKLTVQIQFKYYKNRQLQAMHKFTYNQCDKIQRKMNSFDSLINQFYSQNFQKQIPKNTEINNYRNLMYIQSTVKKEQNDKRIKRVYQSKQNQNPLTNGYFQYKRAGSKHLNYQTSSKREHLSLHKQKSRLRQPLKQRNAENHRKNHLQLPNKEQFVRSKNQKSILQNEYKQIKFEPQNEARINSHNEGQYNKSPNKNQAQNHQFVKINNQLQDIYSNMQAVYQKQIKRGNQKSNQQKYDSINCLNNKIKQIMQKHNYDFSIQQSKNFIPQKRITLPSFRKKIYQNDIQNNTNQVKIFERGSYLVRQGNFSSYYSQKQTLNENKFVQSRNESLSQQKQYLYKNKEIQDYCNDQSFVKQIIQVRNRNCQVNIFEKVQLKANIQNIQKKRQLSHCNQGQAFGMISDCNQINSGFKQNKVEKNKVFKEIVPKGKSLDCFQRIKKQKILNDDLDNSIDLLNQKIKKMEQKKKKLNLNLKPFDFQQFQIQRNKKLGPTSGQNMSQKLEKNYFSCANNAMQFPFNSPNNNQSFLNQSRQNNTLFHQEVKLRNNQTMQSLDRDNKLIGICKIKKQTINGNNTMDRSQIQAQFSKINSNYGNSYRDKIGFDRGIINSNNQDQFSKFVQNKLNKSVIGLKKIQTTKNQVQKLIITLMKQIQLDRQFRSMKIWFQFNKSEPDKWQQLKNCIDQKKQKPTIVKNNFQKLNISKTNHHLYTHKTWNEEDALELNSHQIKGIFSVSLNEHDPFFVLNSQANEQRGKNHLEADNKAQNRYCISNLVQSYKKSEQFWRHDLRGRFDSQQLIRNGFSEHNIDLQKKGSVLIQDLVSFINVTVNSMYRTRDLILIFLRLKQDEYKSHASKPAFNQRSITFKNIISVLCRKQRV